MNYFTEEDFDYSIAIDADADYFIKKYENDIKTERDNR